MDRRDLASRLRWWHSHNGRTAEMVAYGEEDEDGEDFQGVYGLLQRVQEGVRHPKTSLQAYIS